MKIQLTLSPAQIKLLEEAITHSSLYDRLLDTYDPAWIDLKRTINQANDEINYGITRLASYKVIK